MKFRLQEVSREKEEKQEKVDKEVKIKKKFLSFKRKFRIF
jgi:hypothetical protein